MFFSLLQLLGKSWKRVKMVFHSILKSLFIYNNLLFYYTVEFSVNYKQIIIA